VTSDDNASWAILKAREAAHITDFDHNDMVSQADRGRKREYNSMRFLLESDNQDSGFRLEVQFLNLK
jgi:hypothetical protein